MNRYGQMAHDHTRRYRPDSYSQIPDPDAFFAEVGEEIAAEVSRLRDEILGPVRDDETPEEHRLRSYQALATAEELAMADHPLLQPDPSEEAEDWSDDPDLAHHYRDLAEINQAMNTAL
ncbi:hypothetical protein PO878_04435 [Iamia majanohamensis]|uniref:TnpV protein n=1 Tax=Iamia majanohamensis TaxID=467976 RepID=A0AAE9Y6S2_9ACTN|nr:hypothetical protein [Iamia majanohamensis]WCO67970.1 hypothetical protein PO878_04435 [Iamia majanohamensis]